MMMKLPLGLRGEGARQTVNNGMIWNNRDHPAADHDIDKLDYDDDDKDPFLMLKTKIMMMMMKS